MLGFFFVVLVIILWVGSSIVVQSIFDDVHFKKPFFVAIFNNMNAVILLVPYVIKRLRGAEDKAARRRDLDSDDNGRWCDNSPMGLLRLAATVGMLWLVGSLCYNTSLAHTSVATNTVLSSSSSVFTFFFSLILFKDPWRWWSFAAAISSFLGCMIVIGQTPKNIAADAPTNSLGGDVTTVVSAAIFALVSVATRALAPDDFDASAWIGMNGTVNLLIGPVLLLLAHVFDVESFMWPDAKTLLCLTLNAFFGCTVPNALYGAALFMLSPLVVTVSLSATIPVSALADEVLLAQHRFSAGWFLGALFVVFGIVLAALDLEPEKPTEYSDASLPRRGCQTAEKPQGDELQSLIEREPEDDEQEGHAVMKRSPEGAPERALQAARCQIQAAELRTIREVALVV